jgi:hypothetical protein
MDFRNLGPPAVIRPLYGLPKPRSAGFSGRSSRPRPVDFPSFLAFLACAGCVCPHHFSLPSGANEGGGGGSEDASSVRALLATSKVRYLLFLLWILKALLDQDRRGGSSILCAIAMRGPSGVIWWSMVNRSLMAYSPRLVSSLRNAMLRSLEPFFCEL